mmetsp:Transcript_22877/g.29879  ORF Transcript_22877/g.29879 Transcript_22877/m.29879 type:complete len:246 (+) Transcript_22877:109-846(+)
MNRSDIISLAGLRSDGRRAREIRRIRCRFGPVNHHGYDGSAYIEQGQTKILCVVRGPHEPDRRLEGDQCIIKCQYAVAPFAGSEHKNKRPGDRKSVEIVQAVKSTLEGVVCSELYPKTQIDVFLQVIQTDGSTLSACINAASLGLVDAGIAMKDMVVSCSAGHVSGEAVMDLNYVEQSSGGVYLPLAILPKRKEIVLSLMDSKLPLDVFEEVLQIGMEACQQVYVVLQNEVREHASKVLSSRLGK